MKISELADQVRNIPLSEVLERYGFEAKLGIHEVSLRQQRRAMSCARRVEKKAPSAAIIDAQSVKGLAYYFVSEGGAGGGV